MIKVIFDEKDIIELKGIMEQIYHKLRSDAPVELLRAVESATNAAFVLGGEAKRFESELPFFTTFEHLFSVAAQYISSSKGDKGMRDLALYLEYANQIIERMIKKAQKEIFVIAGNLDAVHKKTAEGLDGIKKSLRIAA